MGGQWRDAEKRKATTARYREKHREQIKAQLVAYRKSLPKDHPTKVKARKRNLLRYYRLKEKKAWKQSAKAMNLKARLKRFGLSSEQYRHLVVAQNSKCAICLREESIQGKHKKVKDLAIDHDHSTQVVRGLLCQRCNTGLGAFTDSPALLRAATQYLER